jgi:hypothetical protein
LRLVTTTRQLAENREVTRLIQAGVEEERKRLSRELHDELGQSVTAIRLIAASISRSGESAGAMQGSAKINEIAAGLYDSVHRIVRELRPAVLEQPDLAAALADLGREWRARHPQIDLVLKLDGDLGDLGEAATLAAFRCVQEALTNVLKHAAATTAWKPPSTTTGKGRRSAARRPAMAWSACASGSRRWAAALRQRPAPGAGSALAWCFRCQETQVESDIAHHAGRRSCRRSHGLSPAARHHRRPARGGRMRQRRRGAQELRRGQS